jgi:hypothetical protein
MAGPVLTPEEWHAARDRLRPAPSPGPRPRAALPGSIALILATLDIRPGGA